ncbi:hypothetical protein J1N35_015470 [Gossypium stocksii]|uniref:Uncharacterized protein n=1 Tax=Gossypium stocksii TaxID=47602 RepID=A0A9D3VYD8_9ROSI|nr:hypothetical protein J1N35_015470 [Gossypium stocksii]
MARNAVFQQMKGDASVRQRAILILCMEKGVGSLVYYLTGAKLTTPSLRLGVLQGTDGKGKVHRLSQTNWYLYGIVLATESQMLIGDGWG